MRNKKSERFSDLYSETIANEDELFHAEEKRKRIITMRDSLMAEIGKVKEQVDYYMAFKKRALAEETPPTTPITTPTTTTTTETPSTSETPTIL